MLQRVSIINYLDLKLGIKNINYKMNLSSIVYNLRQPNTQNFLVS